jgi:hypothetical protein
VHWPSPAGPPYLSPSRCRPPPGRERARRQRADTPPPPTLQGGGGDKGNARAFPLASSITLPLTPLLPARLSPPRFSRIRAVPSATAAIVRRRRGDSRPRKPPSCPSSPPRSTTSSAPCSWSRGALRAAPYAAPIFSDSGEKPSNPAAPRLPRAGSERLPPL